MFEDQSLIHKDASKDSDKATSEISGEAKPLNKVAESERRAATRDQYRGYLLHEPICASGLALLDARDRKALRTMDGSQRLLMPTEVSKCGFLLGRSRVLLQIGIAFENDTVPSNKQACLCLHGMV